jgi:F420-dependent oxidoreductase-like protein
VIPAVSIRIRYQGLSTLSPLVQAAEDLGLSGVWVSEPWGYDGGPLLGWVAANTRRVTIGTHIVSVYARTPAATAGLAASLATLSDGRFRLGLGASGPQVVEGWHGVPFDKPIERTRDTIAIVRSALSGEPVEHAGAAVTVPLPGGRGRPLRFSQLGEPLTVPVYLAAMGPRNQVLAAEVADGWSPIPYSPDAHAIFAADFTSALDAADRHGQVRVAPVCPVAVGKDLEALLGLERRWSAFYLAGMGTQSTNFYADAGRKMGHSAMVDAVRERWFAGDRPAAYDAVSAEYADSLGLFGPPERIRERLERYVDAGVDEIVVELRKPDVDDQLDDLRALWDALQD